MQRKVYTTMKEFEEQNKLLSADMPVSENLKILAEEVKIGSKVAPNRLACQAMEGCDGTKDGSPDELTIRRYDRFAKGGAGVIWFEATACREDGRANPRQLWIKEDNLDDFKKIVNDIKETSLKENGYEPIVIMQATHSGRYSKPHGVPAPLIAYNNPVLERENPISKERILSDDEIDTIKEDLIKSTKLADEAGCDGVYIKCCHR